MRRIGLFLLAAAGFIWMVIAGAIFANAFFFDRFSLLAIAEHAAVMIAAALNAWLGFRAVTWAIEKEWRLD